MNISIIGTGYVGLVTGTCLADFSAGRLTFTTDLENQVPPSLRATEGSAAIPSSVIPVSSSPSPLRGEGRVRVKYPFVIARSEASLPLRKQGKQSHPSFVIPACLPYLHRQVKAGIHSSVIAREQSDRSNPNLKRRTGVSPVYSISFDLVSNPEFLREGSAVILPEVFLKALSIARNLGHPVFNFITANFDMIQHYRPTQNVVKRPTIEGGKGYNITGHHELMIPLLYRAILEELK